jgi:hypothetical protein
MSVSTFEELTRSRPERSLIEGVSHRTGGRNAYGLFSSCHV